MDEGSLAFKAKLVGEQVDVHFWRGCREWIRLDESKMPFVRFLG